MKSVHIYIYIYIYIYIIFIFISLVIGYFLNFSNELKPKWMTPAMEEVARLKKMVIESPSSVPQSSRVTRSRVANTKGKLNT